jgi:hypothetical protein
MRRGRRVLGARDAGRLVALTTALWCRCAAGLSVTRSTRHEQTGQRTSCGLGPAHTISGPSTRSTTWDLVPSRSASFAGIRSGIQRATRPWDGRPPRIFAGHAAGRLSAGHDGCTLLHPVAMQAPVIFH